MNLYWFGFGTGLAIGSYYGYSYLKSYVSKYITDQVMMKLNEISNSEEVKFKPFQKQPSALVVFNHGGKSHNICIPFDQNKAKYMRRKDVYLIRDGDEIEITHKPGVPYLLSAEEMGGDSIVVKKDGTILKIYNSTEIPKYLEDIKN